MYFGFVGVNVIVGMLLVWYCGDLIWIVMKIIEIYIDGFCFGNFGFGGWVVLLCYNVYECELSGGEVYIINNWMELMVVIFGFEVLIEFCNIVLFIDFQYVCQGLIQWMLGWICKNWKIVGGDLVKNCELWECLYVVILCYIIDWCWVKGYFGDLDNECVDQFVCDVVMWICVIGLVY